MFFTLGITKSQLFTHMRRALEVVNFVPFAWPVETLEEQVRGVYLLTTQSDWYKQSFQSKFLALGYAESDHKSWMQHKVAFAEAIAYFGQHPKITTHTMALNRATDLMESWQPGLELELTWRREAGKLIFKYATELKDEAEKLYDDETYKSELMNNTDYLRDENMTLDAVTSTPESEELQLHKAAFDRFIAVAKYLDEEYHEHIMFDIFTHNTLYDGFTRDTARTFGIELICHFMPERLSEIARAQFGTARRYFFRNDQDTFEGRDWGQTFLSSLTYESLFNEPTNEWQYESEEESEEEDDQTQNDEEGYVTPPEDREETTDEPQPPPPQEEETPQEMEEQEEAEAESSDSNPRSKKRWNRRRTYRNQGTPEKEDNEQAEAPQQPKAEGSRTASPVSDQEDVETDFLNSLHERGREEIDQFNNFDKLPDAQDHCKRFEVIDDEPQEIHHTDLCDDDIIISLTDRRTSIQFLLTIDEATRKPIFNRVRNPKRTRWS